jgi:ABC-type lipoprotein release transport system permease subunit
MNTLLLDKLELYNYAVLLIGIVFDIMLIIFIIVSCMLVYSLLLMSVETKTFDFAVMRLIGLTSKGFIALIITQAFFFVIPSVILAFGLAVPAIKEISNFIFSAEMAANHTYFPSAVACVRALVIGILIPLFSSIVPIRRALSKNLTDALNIQRAQNSGILITFTNNATKNIIPYLVFGSVSVLFGISIYLLLPLALVSGNLTLLLNIFFAILLGMLVGLTLMVTNVIGIFELLVTYLFFFWESKSLL